MSNEEEATARFMDDWLPGEPEPLAESDDALSGNISFRVSRKQRRVLKQWAISQRLTVSGAIVALLNETIADFKRK